MRIILAGLRELARTLRCALPEADDIVRDERSARASFDRRGFFRAAGAVAAGVCMPLPLLPLGTDMLVTIQYSASNSLIGYAVSATDWGQRLPSEGWI